MLPFALVFGVATFALDFEKPLLELEHKLAELKRSLRERPQLSSFGVQPGTAGVEEDWQAGSRKSAERQSPGG